MQSLRSAWTVKSALANHGELVGIVQQVVIFDNLDSANVASYKSSFCVEVAEYIELWLDELTRYITGHERT